MQQFRFHYSTLGKPHRDEGGRIDNAILLLHWTNASGRALLSQEYREVLFAPGAPLDVNRFWVIVPDEIGHGQSSKPSDGLRGAFPHYRYADMVDLQHKLIVETPGITHLRAVVGMSMGCMNAWQWAESYPDDMDAVMPIACFPAPIGGRNLLWRRISIEALKSDPAWAGGDYRRQPSSLSVALQIASMMIDGVPHLQNEITTPDEADIFLNGVGRDTPNDANDLIYSLESSSDFNAEPSLGRITTKVYALNFADDEFYRDNLQVLQRDIATVRHARLVIRPYSEGSAGHLTMAHPRLWRNEVADFIDWSNTQ